MKKRINILPIVMILVAVFALNKMQTVLTHPELPEIPEARENKERCPDTNHFGTICYEVTTKYPDNFSAEYTFLSELSEKGMGMLSFYSPGIVHLRGKTPYAYNFELEEQPYINWGPTIWGTWTQVSKKAPLNGFSIREEWLERDFMGEIHYTVESTNFSPRYKFCANEIECAPFEEAIEAYEHLREKGVFYVNSEKVFHWETFVKITLPGILVVLLSVTTILKVKVYFSLAPTWKRIKSFGESIWKLMKKMGKALANFCKESVTITK